MFPKCFKEMYNWKVTSSQWSDSRANALWYLEPLISSGMAESTAGTSRRNKSGVLPTPGFASLCYPEIARGPGRERPSVFQPCRKMSALGGRSHTAGRVLQVPTGEWEKALWKGKMFLWRSDKAGGRKSAGNYSECCWFVEEWSQTWLETMSIVKSRLKKLFLLLIIHYPTYG